MTNLAEGRQVFSLDDDTALDPQRAGAKAAWLARGRRAGLPVLDGVVVDAAVGGEYIALGASTLETASSGAARLAVSSAEPPSCVDDLELRAAHMSAPLVVRSSSLLEASGEWSGAFTSYLDLRHGELGIGLLGCWASIYSAATLERFEAARLEPSAASMAVLVQPALDTEFGGTAHVVGGDVEVVGIKGSPAPLVQGWEPGVSAKVDIQGTVSGGAAIDLMGDALLRDVAELLRSAMDTIGATACEWGFADGELVIFQLSKPPPPPDIAALHGSPKYRSAVAQRVARVVRRYPGPTGEALVLPWAIACDDVAPSEETGSMTDIAEIRGMADTLTATTWGKPKAVAKPLANQTLRMLRGHEFDEALVRVGKLQTPDPQLAGQVLGAIGRLAELAVDAGTITDPDHVWWLEPEQLAAVLGGAAPERRDRFGFDRWEPFTAAVVAASGSTTTGAPAASGIGLSAKSHT